MRRDETRIPAAAFPETLGRMHAALHRTSVSRSRLPYSLLLTRKLRSAQIRPAAPARQRFWSAAQSDSMIWTADSNRVRLPGPCYLPDGCSRLPDARLGRAARFRWAAQADWRP